MDSLMNFNYIDVTTSIFLAWCYGVATGSVFYLFRFLALHLVERKDI